MHEKTRSRIGWTLSGLIGVFLGMDGIMKLAQPKPVIDTMTLLGWPTGPSIVVGLGVVLLLATLVYLVPRTSAIGAILLTGYLGGAVATHVRVGSPLFSHVLTPVYFGVILWVALALRAPQVWRALVGTTREPGN